MMCGYMLGTEVIRVRTVEDLKEMWCDIKKASGQNATLWCDGLVDDERLKTSKSGSKRKSKASDVESDDEVHSSKRSQKKKKVENDSKVQEIVDRLKSKHGTQYTVMQLRIWAELVSSGLYASTDEPPCNNSMFQRAGGGPSSSSKRKHDQEPGVTQALTEAASAIVNVLTSANRTTPHQPGQGVSASSPTKLIDSRAKLYKQLSELQNLKNVGVLTDIEYATEKETIMDLLKQLKSK